MSQRQRPRFTGVDTYIDPGGRFTFRFPKGWHQFELEDDREGVLFAPDPAAPRTWFAVWVERLEEHVVAEDYDDLRSGVEEGLAALPAFRLEEERDDLLENLVKFERIFTFDENGVTRKRKLWILYVDIWQIVATFQAENEAEWEHWFAMGNHSFHSFNIPTELWFSVDRDLQGATRERASE